MILYKYRDWQNKHHRTLLTDCALWFSSCKYFNDPFDCKIRPQYEQMTDDQLREYFRPIAESHFPHLNAAERAERVERKVSQIRDQGGLAILNESLDRLKESGVGICTLTELNRDILMWSHYAANHSGFCIGLDTDTLDERFRDYASDNSRFVLLREVEYATQYPVIIPMELKGEQEVDWLWKQICVKAKQWDYEKEFRYFLKGQADVALPIPRSAIKEVILGCQMPDKDQQEIIDVLKSHSERPALFRAKKKDLEFGLAFEEIPY